MPQIKDLFIPHKRNGYRPHAIRSTGLIVFALYIFTFQMVYNVQTGNGFHVLGYATNVNTSALLSETNSHRAANGFASYANSVQLTQAAQAKANHMIANDYWSHYAPDGTTPWYFIDQAGYSYTRAGENLAYGFATSSGVVTGWMNSPGHKANILDSGFAHVGFGIANGANFQGGENTVVVAMYGEPIVSAPAPAPTPAPSPTPASTPAPQPTAAPASAPVSEASEPEQEAEEEPTEEAPEPKQEEDEAEEEAAIASDANNSQRLLAQLAEGGGVVVTGEAASIDAGEGRITNVEALLQGSAHWSLYMIVGGMMAMAMIYFVRHLQSIIQIMIHGEHFVVGHPTLEASVLYLAIWLMMFATYGVLG